MYDGSTHTHDSKYRLVSFYTRMWTRSLRSLLISSPLRDHMSLMMNFSQTDFWFLCSSSNSSSSWVILGYSQKCHNGCSESTSGNSQWVFSLDSFVADMWLIYWLRFSMCACVSARLCVFWDFYLYIHDADHGDAD